MINFPLNARVFLALSILGLVFLPIQSTADVVTLKSGRVVEGEITIVTEYGITIVSKNREESIMYSFIRDVSPSTSRSVPNSKYVEQLRLQFSSHKSSENSKKVQFYMAPWCPYCRSMEQFLVSAGIPYEKLDIDHNESARKGYEELGKGGIPLLVIDGTVIRGNQQGEVKRAWEKWQAKQ